MIVPTARTATLAALAAPLALIVAAAAPGAWVLVPAAGVALLALVVLDGLMAGRLQDVTLIAPTDTEVGEPMDVAVQADIIGRRSNRAPVAAIQCDPRLTDGGRAEIVLGSSTGTQWRGSAPLRPNRRGTGHIAKLWLRWSGPLGLADQQVNRTLDQTVRIWPDLSPVRSPALQVFLRDAQFGLIARRIRGEGSQFESLSEYEPGMDRRRIDWKTSARQTRLFAREFESERNNPIVFAFDCGQAMCEPVDGLPRIDRAVSAALTASYVALKGGDRVALFGFAREVDLITPFVTEARAFHRLQSAAAGLDYHSQEPNFTLALATLSSRLERRSMVVLFSDFSDPTSAELMIESVGRLVQKHVVLFVTMDDVELDSMVAADPADLEKLAEAVSADTLARQRALVLQRLRQLGVDVIEAPWDKIGYRLIDRYLDIKRAGSIG
jgi:uncharacterized protein (DUF58 family)